MGVVDQIDALAATGAISPQLAASYKAQFAMPQPGDVAPQVSSGAPGIGGASFVGPGSPEPKPTPPPAMMDAKGNFAQGGALPGVIPPVAPVVAPSPPDVGTQGWTPGMSAPKTLGADALTAPGGPYAPPAKAFNPAAAAATTNAATAGYHPAPQHGGFTGGPAAPGPDKGAPGYYLGKAYTPQMQSLLAGQLSATGAMSEAQINGADAYAQAAGTKATLMQQAQADAERMMAEQNKREAERQTYMTHAMDLYQQASDEFAQKKIDPDHYWSSLSTPGKILTAIGLFIGIGGGQAGAGATKVVSDSIDKDIETQKSNIGIGMKALEGKRTMLGDRMKIFGDERMAELSTRAEFWKGVEMKTAAVGASYESASAKAKADELVAYAQLQQNQLKQGFEARAEDIVARHDAAAAAAAAAARAKLDKRNEKVFDADLSAKQEWLKTTKAKGAGLITGPDGMAHAVAARLGPDGQPVIGADGKPVMEFVTPTGPHGTETTATVHMPTGWNDSGQPTGFAPVEMDKGQAKDAEKSVKAAAFIKMKLAELAALRAKHGTWAFSGEDRTRASAIVAAVNPMVMHLGELSRMSKEELGQLGQQLDANPLGFKVGSIVGSDKVGAQIAELNTTVDQMLHSAAGAYSTNPTPSLPTTAAPAPTE